MPDDVRTVLADAEKRLADAGVGSPRFDAEELLASVLGTTRMRLHHVEAVPGSAQARFETLVQRRSARVPLQHLTGSAGFRHLDIAVGPGVFVPRPETELVAGAAIEFASAAGDQPVAVDLCTGSGAIALALSAEVPAARVYACEVDPSAHAWAEHNLAGHDVQLVLADAAGAFPELDGTVDVVVANPPYIPLEAYESVQPEVRDHDPALALWSGDDGLDAIRVLEQTAARLLRGGGHVIVEHADAQAETAPRVFSATSRWARVRDNPDLAGRPRFVTAERR